MVLARLMHPVLYFRLSGIQFLARPMPGSVLTSPGRLTGENKLTRAPGSASDPRFYRQNPTLRNSL